MPYVTLQDVRSALPQVPITANSKPNEGQVDEFITETEKYVDAILTGIGYTTPVTGDTAVTIVREIVRAGVIARTLNARDLGVKDPEIGGGAHQQRKFDRMMERLQAHGDPLHLKDANPTTTKPAQYARGFISDEEPYFTVEKEY